MRTTTVQACWDIDDFRRVIHEAVHQAEWSHNWISVEVVVGYELLPNTIIGNGWYAMRDDVRTVRTDDSIVVVATYLVQRKGT